uniref:Uncharacterized protein n=1 Tax=Arundo donax TaxID=35708 RepID=A0A0A9HLP8_ARUDO
MPVPVTKHLEQMGNACTSVAPFPMVHCKGHTRLGAAIPARQDDCIPPKKRGTWRNVLQTVQCIPPKKRETWRNFQQPVQVIFPLLFDPSFNKCALLFS